MRLFRRWDQLSRSDETDEIAMRISQVLVSRINDTQLRSHLGGLLARRDWMGLLDFELDYESASVSDAINCRQVLALFSKRRDLRLDGVDRTKAAVLKFIESELLCRETNSILRSARLGEFSFLPGVDAVIYRARLKIAQILGDVPNLSDLKLRYGPGATTTVPRRTASARRKLGSVRACSEELLPAVRRLMQELPFLDPRCGPRMEDAMPPVDVHTGKLVFVPKSAKIDRPVVVEPELNTMCQLGIGDHISRRLRRYGVNLQDQTRNQRLALQGSVSGALATLDLSSASDTIAFELIPELLPVDWYLFLSSFRTGKVTYDGSTVRLEKFSSMGNGFTFPLETLIFFGLALSCCESDEEQALVSVYGDDIIIPSHRYERLCMVLHALGFKPNAKKSFATGPFRESCGADYLSGINIRPVYLTGPLAGFDVFRLHNFWRRNYDDELADLMLSLVDPSARTFGPDGYGDGHLVTRDDGWRHPHKRGAGWSGYTFETYVFSPRRDFTSFPGDYVYPCYSVYASGEYPRAEPAQRASHRLLPSGREALRSYALEISSLSEAPVHAYRRGVLGVSVPGTGACKLIKVYTLS